MESILGEGTFGEVHKALDSQTNKKVAIKIFDNLDETLPEIEEDYAVISTHWIHPNIPHFMGLFLKVRMREYSEEEMCQITSRRRVFVRIFFWYEGFGKSYTHISDLTVYSHFGKLQLQKYGDGKIHVHNLLQ